MKKFLCLPYNFQGVAETSHAHIFRTIVDRNVRGFISCYQSMEDLFQRLISVYDQFKVIAEEKIELNFKIFILPGTFKNRSCLRCIDILCSFKGEITIKICFIKSLNIKPKLNLTNMCKMHVYN